MRRHIFHFLLITSGVFRVAAVETNSSTLSKPKILFIMADDWIELKGTGAPKLWIF